MFLYDPNAKDFFFQPRTTFPYEMYKASGDLVLTVTVNNEDERQNYFSQGYTTRYIYQEYPLMLYRVVDGALENVMVNSDAEKEKALAEGYTTDYASLVNDDGAPKIPEEKAPAKVEKGAK